MPRTRWGSTSPVAGSTAADATLRRPAGKVIRMRKNAGTSIIEITLPTVNSHRLPASSMRAMSHSAPPITAHAPMGLS